MTHALFDTLEYVKLLRQVNFEQHQAEGLSKAQMMVAQSILTHTATQNDLIIMTTNLRVEIHQIRDELRAEIHQIRDELRAEMYQIRDELRNDIQALSIKIDTSLETMKVYSLKLFIAAMVTNLTIIGVSMSALALILK
jgi:hypothetical protein